MPERSPEASDDTGVRANRRRARALCLVPALVAGIVLGIVLAAAVSLIVGVIVLVVITAVGALALWAASPRLVIRALGARSSDEDEYPRLFTLVDGLCATLGLPAPSIVVVESPLANALSVGRGPDTAVLVVTSGLDAELSLVQLEGVLAHELVHVKQHDNVLSAPAVMVATPYSWLAGPVRGTDLVHRLVGRGREFAADQRAAQVVRYPPGLEGALESMAGSRGGGEWPPARGRMAMLTRWLWIDPRPTGPATTQAPGFDDGVGDLDDTPVRAAALALQ